VAVFEEKAKQARDADVRAHAEKTVPKLREHLKMARLGEDGAENGIRTHNPRFTKAGESEVSLERRTTRKHLERPVELHKTKFLISNPNAAEP